MPCEGELRKHKKALTVKEVADYLSVSERQIYQLVTENGIPHFKVGKSVRFDGPSLADWLYNQLIGREPQFGQTELRKAYEGTFEPIATYKNQA